MLRAALIVAVSLCCLPAGGVWARHEIPRAHPRLLGSAERLRGLASARPDDYARVVRVAREPEADDHAKMISTALVSAVEGDGDGKGTGLPPPHGRIALAGNWRTWMSAGAGAFRRYSSMGRKIPQALSAVLFAALAASFAPVEASQVEDLVQESGEVAWGEAVEGVQVRLRADKTVWAAGEVPHFAVDVRNRGTRDMTIAPTQDTCEVEFDGEWYTWPPFARYSRRALLRGGEVEGIVVSLFDIWRGEEHDKPLALAPGMYMIRVACQPEYRKSPRESQVVRAVSNPVRIRVLPGRPPVAAEQWGPPVQGVRCRLRAEKPIWGPGKVPMLRADVRNGSERDLHLTPVQELCELEVDGAWHRWAEPVRLGIKIPPFSPGREILGIRISLDRRWGLRDADDRLHLGPGKHTFRVAFIARPAGSDEGGSVRSVSNPVEMEILTQDEAGEPAWGDAVEGVQVRGPDEEPSLGPVIELVLVSPRRVDRKAGVAF